ncbi:MAG: hypothetical protein H2172_12010 [Opitutus sp.]|nr:hypothetical protein [Opitutus sp.]MCS6247135.1 hypothetical protein [Opitutus sp.]MCS6273537.1 hypothetical protein [Opitutus sp.]MCS6299879.1 hypothetical protein [Opitutus sp.]
MILRIAIVLAALFFTSVNCKAEQLQAFRTISGALVVAVEPTRIADVVLLGAGFETGLRQGMVFSIMRSGVKIAEVVLVELRPRASAAIIIHLLPGQTIRSGDTANVKTLKV